MQCFTYKKASTNGSAQSRRPRDSCASSTSEGKDDDGVADGMVVVVAGCCDTDSRGVEGLAVLEDDEEEEGVAFARRGRGGGGGISGRTRGREEEGVAALVVGIVVVEVGVAELEEGVVRLRAAWRMRWIYA